MFGWKFQRGNAGVAFKFKLWYNIKAPEEVAVACALCTGGKSGLQRAGCPAARQDTGVARRQEGKWHRN